MERRGRSSSKDKSPRQPVTGEARIVGPGFRAAVYAKVGEVPFGAVTTYGDVAGALGSRRVARQVGFALAALEGAEADEVPWHRVVNGQGTISYRGDTGRGDRQQRRLEAEGIAFDDDGRIVDFGTKRHRFPVPASTDA